MTSLSPIMEDHFGHSTFVDSTVKHLKTHCGDSAKRKQQAIITKQGTENRKISDILQHGIWNSTDFYRAITKFGCTKNVKWFQDNNIGCQFSLPSTYFKHLESEESSKNIRKGAFRINKGVSPSAALESIHSRRFVILDSGLTRWVAVYQAFKDLLGEKKFDHLFSWDSPTPLRLSNDKFNPLKCLYDDCTINHERAVKTGDLCCFSNSKDYTFKHPLGSARELHVLCIDAAAKKYIGLGLNASGATTKEVETYLRDEYNSTPDESIVSEDIWKHVFSRPLGGEENFYSIKISPKVMKGLKLDQVTEKEFAESAPLFQCPTLKSSGKLYPVVLRPNLTRIQKLQNAALEDIREVFMKFVENCDLDTSIEIPGNVDLF